MVRLGDLSSDAAGIIAADLVQDYGLGARVGIMELGRTYPALAGWAIEHVYRGYNEKHWGMPLAEVPRSVLARLPFVVGEQETYFTDKYQAVPVEGYTRIIERMLDHPKIKVSLGHAIKGPPMWHRGDRIIWTGSPDDFFGEAGALPYRSVEFRNTAQNVAFAGVHQGFATVTFPSKQIEITRTTSMGHLNPPGASSAYFVEDLPCAHVPGKNDPFYPIPLEPNIRLAQEYDARRPKNIWFAGRLGSYTYLNMDQAIAQALALVERIRA
jgi:UDP-galactopyranose mutase